MVLVDLPELNQGRSGSTESVKLINRIRSRVNLLPDAIISVSLRTEASGIFEVIWGSAIETNTTYKLTASVIASTADGLEGAAYTIEAAIINTAGIVTFIGGTQQKTFERETNVAADAEFALSGGIVGLQVKDAGGQPTFWHARIYAEKLV